MMKWLAIGFAVFIFPCASIGAVTEKMIAAYIAQQEEASSENVIKVSDK